MRSGVAVDVIEIECEAQCLAVLSSDTAQAGDDVIGVFRIPRGGILEVIEDADNTWR